MDGLGDDDMKRRCSYLRLFSTFGALSLFLFVPEILAGDSSQWQTVFPDTQVVLPLFGQDGPKWTLHSTDGIYSDIPARIPGDLLSDLERADIIGNPYYERNFLTQRSVWMGPPSHDNSSVLEKRTRTWTYTTYFELEAMNPNDMFLLVLEGVKMGASVAVNGIVLGNVSDQFLRYKFVLNSSVLARGIHEPTSIVRRELAVSRHHLSISFDPLIETDGRFMACSGGWDWAPYSRAGDERGSRVFSFGIFKPVYIVKEHVVSITHVVPKIYYLGPYARKPMLRGPEGDFRVVVDVHMETHGETVQWPKSASIVLRNNFGNTTNSETSVSVPRNSGVVTLSTTASKDEIELWWPNGLGEQKLYTIEVSYHSNGYQSEWIRKKIGFRTCALVTVNDTDDSTISGIVRNNSEGSGLHGMFFRVNGAPIWSRGANVVPMDQLEGRLTDDAHRIMVLSAAEAKMNMLRIWGGGMILPNAFYDACDRKGILIYHDMMFVEEQYHGPTQSQKIEDEIRFIVRELSSHPSIVLWSGCNECTVRMKTETDIYATFVMQTVAQEDDTRSIWPSCPAAAGWQTGVNMIDGRPNGRSLSTMNSTLLNGSMPLETHGPYQHGFSTTYPSVNGQDDGWRYPTNIPAKLTGGQIGFMFRNHFVSEFGASTFPSFESLSATLSRRHWNIHGGSLPDSCHPLYGNENFCNGSNVMAERNYACDSHIEAFFGTTDLESVGRGSFRAQLHHCTMAHALWMKGQIEAMRSANSFGTLVWQLNENWPTGGWGLIEYGSKTKMSGQVVGGRWTPIMYLLKSALYRDVFASCGTMSSNAYACFCRNDGIKPFHGTLLIESLNLSTGVASTIANRQLNVTDIEMFQLTNGPPKDDEAFVLSVIDVGGDVLIDEYVVLGNAPKSLSGLSSHVTIKVLSIEANAIGDAVIALQSDAVALYVVLTALAEGSFDDNAFLLKPTGSPKIVKFTWRTGQVDLTLLRNSLRVEHLASDGYQKVLLQMNRKL